ncbi:MAG TPA: hypothetical protein VJ770_30015, partial [Stellaceae bacterium]|nr:hypothetical protein [Stellaceae bacterium]
VSTALDCGDEPGAALAAIRARVEAVVFTGRADVARRLAEIARKEGVGFAAARPEPALDLGADFFVAEELLAERCVDLLSRTEFRLAPAAASETGSGETPTCRPR